MSEPKMPYNSPGRNRKENKPGVLLCPKCKRSITEYNLDIEIEDGIIWVYHSACGTLLGTVYPKGAKDE